MARYVFKASTGLVKVKHRVSLGLAAVAAMAVPVVGVLSMGGASAASQVVVTPTSTQGWIIDDTRPGGATTFVADVSAPGTPHTGALHLTTDNTTTSKAQYMHAANTPLSGVTELSYSTKQNGSPVFPGAAASYQLPVLLDGTSSTFTTLVFEPYENGTVTPGVWQNWDVAGGQLWSSKSAGSGACSTVAGFGGAPFYTLAGLKAACPNAVVAGFGVNIGSNNPGYDVETDLFNFNGTTYNFEATAPAPTVSAPVITTPANNSTMTSAQAVKIDWTDSVASIGGPVTYNYGAYSDAAYTSLVYSQSGLTASEIPTPNTPAGVYYVQVQAKDADGNLSAWSNSAANPFKITIHNPVVLASKDACKNDGWKTSEAPVFKNQGDCVSFFATKGKN